MKLSIGQKGILVAGIPLLFELLFVGMLMVELAQARQEAQVEAHAVAIVAELNGIRGITEEAYGALIRYKTTRKDESLARYDASISSIQDALRHLKQLAGRDRFDRREVEKLSKIVANNLDLLKECRQNLIGGSEFASFSEAPRLFRAASDVKLAMDDLASKYSGASRKQSLGERKRTEKFQYTIYAGLVLNIFGALLMALFMSKNITARVQTLRENSRRLAKDQGLLPSMKDEDEISELDNEFRSMAQQLTVAQQSLRTMTDEARAGEANIRSIIENMPLGMILMNDKEVIELVNPALERMFGCSREDLENNSVTNTLNQFGLHSDAAASSTTQNGSKSEESIARTLAGSQLYVEKSIRKFVTSETGKKQSLMIIQDVSERHEIERLKQEFVAMVSHELRAPLNGVMATLELTADGIYGELSETGQKRVSLAVQNIDRLIGLINDLLDVEKMEAGKLTLSLKPVDLDELIIQAVDSIRTFAESSKVSLQYERSEAHAHADKDRITQVLINLLSNAIKFSNPGDKVLVELERLANMAEVRVIDCGKGIPAEDLDRLFQRFQQVHSATAAAVKGTGLGLAISKAIVEQHHGLIGVSSVAGKGSTFYFRIPLAEN